MDEAPQDRYNAKALCLNCGWKGIVTPLHGLYVHTETCPNCQLGPITGEAMHEASLGTPPFGTWGDLA